MSENKVTVDADLYVLLASGDEALWARLNSRIQEGIPSKLAFREHDAVHRRHLILPNSMPDWRHVQIAVDADEVERRAAARTISEEGLRHVPDTLDWAPLRVVSARFRECLEGFFPDGSQFFPFHTVDPKSGAQQRADFWYWLPRNYLAFKPKVKRNHEQLMRPRVWGTLGGQDVTWEMYHNTGFQEYVQALPFWTSSPTFNQVVFRRDLYYALKSSGFTGLEESAEDNYLRHTPEQCVGYIRFKGRSVSE